MRLGRVRQQGSANLFYSARSATKATSEQRAYTVNFEPESS